MEDRVKEDLHLRLSGKRHLRALLHILTFQDGNHIVMYSPSLSLSAYGDTKQEAEEMFSKVIFPDFCENLFMLPEPDIFLELKRLGWLRNPMFKKDLHKETYVDTKGILKDFNLSEETEVSGELVKVN